MRLINCPLTVYIFILVTGFFEFGNFRAKRHLQAKLIVIYLEFNRQQHRLTKGYNEGRKEIVFLRRVSLNATYSSEQYLLVTINAGKRLSWLPQNIII